MCPGKRRGGSAGIVSSKLENIRPRGRFALNSPYLTELFDAEKNWIEKPSTFFISLG
jgi:hypothetical protein